MDQEFWKGQELCFQRAARDIWESRRSSTVEKYCYSLRQYFEFCRRTVGRVKLPVKVPLAAKFLVDLREQGMSKSSIRLALVSLKWVNNFFPDQEGEHISLESKFLSALVDSAQRNIRGNKNQKLPFTVEMVRKMINVGLEASLESLRNALIVGLSFGLVLRNDELIHISCKHLTWTPEGVKIVIVSSKTDAYRKGKTLFLAKQKGVFSVYNLLIRYMEKGKLKVGDDKYLFGRIVNCTGGGYVNGTTAITYSRCLDIVKDKVEEIGLNPNLYATHSCRSGAASTLAPRVTPFELLVTGRWSDPRSLNNYVEIDEDRRYEISRKLFV